jgi:hypothetical protein
MLSIAYRRFDGRVPEPGATDEEDREFLKKAEAGFETVGELCWACSFRAVASIPSGQAWGGIVSGPRGQRLPGPQGALAPDQGGSRRIRRFDSLYPYTDSFD